MADCELILCHTCTTEFRVCTRLVTEKEEECHSFRLYNERQKFQKTKLTFLHGCSGRNTTSDGLEQLVVVVGSGPVLVCKRLDAMLPLLALDALHISEHAACGVVPGECIHHQCVGVEASQRDELPAIAHPGQLRDEVLHLLVRHSGRVPVEGGREVVGEHGVRVRSADALCELPRLGHIGRGCFHPEQVGMRREGTRSGDAGRRTALETVVALAGAWKIPVPENVAGAELGGQFTRLGVRQERGVRGVAGKARLALPFLQPSAALPIAQPRHRPQFVRHNVGKRPQVGGAEPGVLHCLQLRTSLALCYCLCHHVHQVLVLDGGVGGAQDENVVPRVDIGLQQRGGHRVAARDDQGLDAHDVALQPGGHEPIDVLRGGHQYLFNS